ncbi:MAG: carbamate kinase [Bacillota bacterium]
MDLVVVALGGNAILQPKQKGTIEEQLANVSYSARQIVKLVQKGKQVVVTHGNGPQVGNILLQNTAAKEQVPAMPLDVCGAESQGLLGYMIQQSIKNELQKMGSDIGVVTVLTQVVVDRKDSAFANPTKPVGPFYSRAEAEFYMKEKNELWIEDSGRGWRKVVPSPIPKDIIELEIIRSLVQKNCIVIAAGGGGIPVERKSYRLSGVEAVIDKDLTSSLLAKKLGARMLVIATDVERVAINWGTDKQKSLEKLTIAEAKKYLKQGEFLKGSMEPKIKAAINFVEAGGEALIISLANLENGFKEGQGTKIVDSL